MEFSWFHFDPPFLIKTNKIWTSDTKCEGGGGGDAHHT